MLRSHPVSGSRHESTADKLAVVAGESGEGEHDSVVIPNSIPV